MAGHFRQNYVDDHEYEAKASPMAADSITKLRSGEGARKFDARSRSREREQANSPASRGVLIGVAIAALVVIVAGFLLVRAILGQAHDLVEVTSDLYPTEAQQAEKSVDESGSTSLGSIDYVDESFSMVPGEDGVEVVATDEGGNQHTLFVLEGEPATFFLYNGTLIIPENLEDGWDVIAFVLDSDAVPSQVVVNGSPVAGDGEVADASLEGNVLVVKDSTGGTTRVEL